LPSGQAAKTSPATCRPPMTVLPTRRWQPRASAGATVCPTIPTTCGMVPRSVAGNAARPVGVSCRPYRQRGARRQDSPDNDRLAHADQLVEGLGLDTARIWRHSVKHVSGAVSGCRPNLAPRADIWPTDTAPVIRQVETAWNSPSCARAFHRPGPRPRPSSIPGRKAAFAQVTLPGARFAFFRVHRLEIAEVEMEVHQARRRLILLRRSVASDAGGAGDAFTPLTTEPGPDVAPIHNRQVIVLERTAWRVWLRLEQPEAELLCPLPVGSLAVEQVR